MSVPDLVCASDFDVWVEDDGRTFVTEERNQMLHHQSTADNRTADRIRVVFTISLTGMWEDSVDCNVELLGEVYLISTVGRNPTRISTFTKVMNPPRNHRLRLNAANTARRIVYEYESIIRDYDPDIVYDATFKRVYDDEGDMLYYLFTGVTH